MARHLAMQIILYPGMVLDDIAIITICAPIHAHSCFVGIQPYLVWRIFVLNMQMAYMSPPPAGVDYDESTAPPEIKWKTSGLPLPFLGMQALVLLLVMFFPVLHFGFGNDGLKKKQPPCYAQDRHI